VAQVGRRPEDHIDKQWLAQPLTLGRKTPTTSILAIVGRRAGVLGVSYYNCSVEIHLSAGKHAIADEDIEHAVEHAMTIEDQDDDTRLYLGPARSAALLEVATIRRDDGSELAIHAMPMRAKYQRLLPGG
jgi:hypothetical protein